MSGSLVLVRHGQSEWNLKNLFTGWKDPDLTGQGIAEAREAGRKGGVTVSQDRDHMAAIGREGGESRSAAARQARQRPDREVPLTVTRDGLDGRRTELRPLDRLRPDLSRTEILADG